MVIEFNKLSDNVRTPEYNFANDAGADVFMPSSYKMKKGENVIPLGFSAIIPSGYCALLCLRSSWMSKGLVCNHAPVDADYSGEWHLLVYNSGEEFELEKGDRICQIVILPIIQAQFIEPQFINTRSSNGIGSTGK